MEYTFNEYADMYLMFGEQHLNARAAAVEYSLRFPERRHPSHKVFLRLDNRIRTTGNVVPSRPDAGRPRTTRTPEMEENVLDIFDITPEASCRQVGNLIGVGRNHIGRILAEAGRHPYHFTRVQGLLPEDYAKRTQFCRWLIEKADEDSNFLSHVLWTDESIFTRNGFGNIHNMHHWATQNPHVIFPCKHQHRFSINVWVGILNDRVIGPIMLPNRINGRDFLRFLAGDIEDELDNLPLNLLRNLWFQLDGAPPHYSADVRDWLNHNFPDRWIERGGPVAWPPRSPDLNPLDFFLWGFLKERAYANPLNTQAELEQRIVDAVGDITPNLLQRVKGNLIRRAEACINNGGRNFEHLL